jgi:hypothetical protein
MYDADFRRRLKCSKCGAGKAQLIINLPSGHNP